MKVVPCAAREARRLQAWKLHQQGWSQRAIADLLEVNEASVSRWFKRARAVGGAKALHRRKASGAARRLPRARWRELRALLRQGAEAHGFHGALWMRERVGRFHSQMRERAFDAVAVTEFLRHLLCRVAGPVLVIWDGAPIHRSKLVKAFLQTEANGRLELEPLPGYAPDLNPLDCGVWHWLKNVALANVCATDLVELKRELRAATTRLRRKPSLIKASFIEAKLA